MGKRSRLERRREEKIKVDDAAETIAAIRMWADAPPHSDPGSDWIQGRCQTDYGGVEPQPSGITGRRRILVGALLNSNADVELVPDWLKRFPFNTVAFTLPEPVSLHDGHRICHYRGMIVRGINNRITPRAAAVSRLRRPDGGAFEHVGLSHTSYANIPRSSRPRSLNA